MNVSGKTVETSTRDFPAHLIACNNASRGVVGIGRNVGDGNDDDGAAELLARWICERLELGPDERHLVLLVAPYHATLQFT